MTNFQSLLTNFNLGITASRLLISMFRLMTENTSSKNLWALSTFAAAIGDGAAGFAADDHESFRRQEFVFAVAQSSADWCAAGAASALKVCPRQTYRRCRYRSRRRICNSGRASRLASHEERYQFPRQTTVPHLLVARLQHHARAVLTLLTIKGDTAYYALMLASHPGSAFRLDLRATLTVVMLADIITFMGAYGMKFGEYIEAGAIVGDLQRDGSAGLAAGQQSSRARGELCAQSRGTRAHPPAIARRRKAGRHRTTVPRNRARDPKSGRDDLQLARHRNPRRARTKRNERKCSRSPRKKPSASNA